MKVPAEFHWSSEQESLLLASFFYGFFVTQWVGGVAAPIIGGGRLVGLAMTASAILSIVTPFFAHLGYVTFFTARTLTGLIQVNISLVLDKEMLETNRWFDLLVYDYD